MTSPFEEGDPSARIAFLGEAPAKSEMRSLRPFSGYAGMLFNELLGEAGIAREDCYITNVFENPIFKSRDEKLWFDEDGDTVFITGKGFTAKGGAIAQRALSRLSATKANVIVPLGGAALYSLFQDTRISKWRGSILESKTLPGRKLVPTFHPSFIQRGNHIHRYTVIHDLKRVRDEAGSPRRKLSPRTLHIDPIFPDVREFFKEALAAPRIATDIEVLNHNVSCFSIAISDSEAMSIPLIRGQAVNDRWDEAQEAWIWMMYAKLLGNPNTLKINQNILFDISFLLQKNHIFTRGPLGCTMIAHHIMYPDFPKGLDFICSTYTREPYYKDDGKLWSKPWVDIDRFWRYNALDAVVAFEAWGKLEKELATQGYQWTYDKTLAMFEPLIYMMVHGIKLDINNLAITREDAKNKLAAKEADLKIKAEWDFNPGSPKQCQEYFYVTKGIKPYTSTKTGQITTDDKALARIYKRHSLPEAKLAQEIRGLRKLISNYLEVKYDSDERVRCSYNPRGTTTGRLSSSETVFDTGMNFQNLESEFKNFLVCDPPSPVQDAEP